MVGENEGASFKFGIYSYFGQNCFIEFLRNFFDITNILMGVMPNFPTFKKHAQTAILGLLNSKFELLIEEFDQEILLGILRFYLMCLEFDLETPAEK